MSETLTENTSSAEKEPQEKTAKSLRLRQVIFSAMIAIGAAAGIILRDMIYTSVIYAALAMSAWLVAGAGCALLRKYSKSAFLRHALLILSVLALVELGLVAYFLIQTAI
jgi:hypothetical protein